MWPTMCTHRYELQQRTRVQLLNQSFPVAQGYSLFLYAAEHGHRGPNSPHRMLILSAAQSTLSPGSTTARATEANRTNRIRLDHFCLLTKRRVRVRTRRSGYYSCTFLIGASKVTTRPYYNTFARPRALKLGERLLLHPWAVPVASYRALGPSGAQK